MKTTGYRDGGFGSVKVIAGKFTTGAARTRGDSVMGTGYWAGAEVDLLRARP